MTDHAAYLDAKRALDDRSLNRDVLDRFAAELPPEPQVLEVGVGTATMVERLVDWGVIEVGRWVAVDAHEEALGAGEARIGDAVGGVAVEFRAADAFEFASESAAAGQRFDAVVGCAFFDVVGAAPAVDALGEVAPVAYAPITYDGETRFAPPDPDDDAVLGRYHRHMREFRPGGPDGAAALAREATVIAEGTVAVADRAPVRVGRADRPRAPARHGRGRGRRGRIRRERLGGPAAGGARGGATPLRGGESRPAGPAGVIRGSAVGYYPTKPVGIGSGIPSRISVV